LIHKKLICVTSVFILVLGRGVAFFQAERPFDAAENMHLVFGAFPDVFKMAERRIKDAALAVIFAPGNGKDNRADWSRALCRGSGVRGPCCGHKFFMK
jgi:hypothetical protein